MLLSIVPSLMALRVVAIFAAGVASGTPIRAFGPDTTLAAGV